MDIQKIIGDKIFTVSEFNGFVNSVLTPLRVTVEGEVSEWRVSQNKFVWFTIKDQAQALNCFSLIYRVRQPVETGMRVRVMGYPKIYEKSGKFSFVVESLELTGEGSLKKAFEMLQVKLEKEGLFDPSRKRKLPRFPKQIGLITSAGAAAYTDFLRQLQNRLGGLQIQFIPVAVQGPAAIPEITAALQQLNHNNTKPDVIVLTRGGGSLEDLQAFNSEEIARAVFASEAPTVVAIGHERDVSLAELAGDVRAATPTAAAQMIVPLLMDLQSELQQNVQSQSRLMDQRAMEANHRLTTTAQSLFGNIQTRQYRIRASLQRFGFAFERTQAMVARARQKLAGAQVLLRSLSPLAVLKRGYSIVQKNGKIIRSSQEVDNDEKIEITLHRGGIEATVVSTHDEYHEKN